MLNKKLFAGLVGLFLASSAYALSPDKFTSMEYHVNTGVEKTLPYATKALTPEFKEAFSFINFSSKSTSIKLVTFFDTPDRAFKNSDISIRVREHVTTPRKSKITVKLRAADPEGFGDVSNYRKAEIDYTKGKLAYSVSYDIPYSPSKINVKSVDYNEIEKVLKTNKTVWAIVGDIFKANKKSFKQTMVMRTHGWEGYLDDKRFDDIEIDFQVWTPFYRQPRISFNEFSFKGHSKDDARLKAAYDVLFEKVNAVGFDGGHEGSKTNSTFEMSKAFQ